MGLTFIVGASLLAMASHTQAQGILTVTPSTTLTTLAGTGATGYSGDGGAASAATLAAPSAVAYDAAGNLFFADAQNHVVREISRSGQISTVAGNGLEGYGGDGAAATAATLDTPTGVAVDASGNIYIADSHNHRIRKVSGGTISTIAGTGTPGFAGDGGAATAAQLWLPSAVAVDASGNVYVADTNNQRIRKISGSTIATIAGDGEELFAGDGAAATAAVLDSPTGVAVDAAGNVYIADRHNQRIRMVTPGGTISTVAGSGGASFSGAYGGDGASPAAASLSRPSGVSVDAGGNIYIADTGNQRIRIIAGGAGGTIGSVAGSNQQGFAGDAGAATNATLNMPRAVAANGSGGLAIADKLNQRIRTTTLPSLSFANSGVGILSTPQSVTLANTGSAPITVSSIVLSGAFTTATGGSCTATPITLAAGANCTESIAFLPTAFGPASGSVVLSGSGVIPQTILLGGTALQSTTTVALSSNVAAPFVSQPIVLTAAIQPAGVGTPTGTVLFYDGTTLLNTATVNSGSASFTTALPAGPQTLTAVYGGDTNFTGNTSPALSELVTDFSFAPGSSVLLNQTVQPGQTASYAFNVQPIGGAFTLPITLTATGVPAGATVTFTPQTITLGASPASFTVAIKTSATTASLAPHSLFGGGVVALSLMLLPFSFWKRHRLRGLRPLTLCLALLFSLAAIGGLSGCGSNSGFFGQPSQTYTINIVGTATGAGGATLQHSIPVTLTVQ